MVNYVILYRFQLSGRASNDTHGCYELCMLQGVCGKGKRKGRRWVEAVSLEVRIAARVCDSRRESINSAGVCEITVDRGEISSFAASSRIPSRGVFGNTTSDVVMR